MYQFIGRKYCFSFARLRKVLQVVVYLLPSYLHYLKYSLSINKLCVKAPTNREQQDSLDLPLRRRRNVRMHSNRTDGTTPRMRQNVQILLSQLIHQHPVIIHDLSSVFRYPHPHHPSLQTLRVLHAQKLYILRRLRLLQSRMLDRKAEIRRSLVFLFPTDSVINLIILKRRQTHEISCGFCLFFLEVVKPRRSEHEMMFFPAFFGVGFQVQRTFHFGEVSGRGCEEFF